MEEHTGPEDAVHFWSARARLYDTFIRRVVPGYDTLLERLVEAVPGDARSVLELGCGNGNLSLRLLEQAPAAELTLLDASAEMLEVARARLAEHRETRRLRFVQRTFEQLEAEPARYDVAVSALALHHVAEPLTVYQALHASMVVGGRLRIADGYAAADADLDSLQWRRWQDFWRQPGNLDDEEIEGVLAHARDHDHYHPIERHFEWLRAAGFHACDCVWRDGLFAVIAARA
jgi:tRNA (cmo5U34)-methyltransferase